MFEDEVRHGQCRNQHKRGADDTGIEWYAALASKQQGTETNRQSEYGNDNDGPFGRRHCSRFAQ